MKKRLLLMLAIVISLSIFGCGKKETVVGTRTFDVSKNYTICISSSTDGKEFDAIRKGFVVGLKDFGLVEDINVTYHYESAMGNPDYASQIVDAFKGHNPDLYVTIGNPSTDVTKSKVSDKPIVFLAVANAEQLGYCKADGTPNSNMTGVIDSHLIQEQLDYIHKNNTDVKKIGVIHSGKNKLAEFDIDYLRFYAMNYDIDIYTVSINKPEDIDKALDNILPKVDALNLVPDYIVDQNLTKVMDRVKKDHKLVFGNTSTHKDAGADVSTERDYALVGEKGAEIAKRILVDGEKANNIKVETIDFKID